MTTAQSSKFTRAAVWALLPADPPGITGFDLIDAIPQYTSAYIRSTLLDLVRLKVVRCARRQFVKHPHRERIHYWRIAASLPVAEAVVAASGRKQRPCLRCHKSFMSEWVGNRLCRLCCGIHDARPESAHVVGVRMRT